MSLTWVYISQTINSSTYAWLFPQEWNVFRKIDAWGDRVVIKGIGCELGELFWLKNHTIWQHWKIGIVKSDSIHHFLESASTKSGTLQFPPFSGCELWIYHFVYDGSCLSLQTNHKPVPSSVIFSKTFHSWENNQTYVDELIVCEMYT
jgi:hypothetical protein